MEILVSLVVGAGILLGLEWAWGRSAAWPQEDVPVRAAPRTAEDDGTTIVGGLFPAEFVHRRLAALAAELDRLDQDPDVFAKAFHTLAARAAYQALLAESSRLAEESRGSVGPAVGFDPPESSSGGCEVLEL